MVALAPPPYSAALLSLGVTKQLKKLEDAPGFLKLTVERIALFSILSGVSSRSLSFKYKNGIIARDAATRAHILFRRSSRPSGYVFGYVILRNLSGINGIIEVAWHRALQMMGTEPNEVTRGGALWAAATGWKRYETYFLSRGEYLS